MFFFGLIFIHIRGDVRNLAIEETEQKSLVVNCFELMCYPCSHIGKHVIRYGVALCKLVLRKKYEMIINRWFSDDHWPSQMLGTW